MFGIGTWFKRPFCSHKHSVIKVEGNRLYTQCLNCLDKSPGITPFTPTEVEHAISGDLAKIALTRWSQQ